MTKADKLGLCDWMLVFSTAIARGFKHAARSHGRPRCVVGMASRGCRLLVFRQHRLASVSAFRLEVLDSASAEAKSRVTRWLAILAFLTFISAFIALVHWVGEYMHSPIGGIHGKIGLVFLVLAIGHTVKRIRFFKSRRLSKCA